MVTIKGIRVKLVNYESCSDSFRSILVCFNFQGSSSRGPRALLALFTSSISYLTYLAKLFKPVWNSLSPLSDRGMNLQDSLFILGTGFNCKLITDN